MRIRLPRLTLVLGGGASGKSRYAERQALMSGLSPVYVATASPRDEEMRLRIERHRSRRGPEWTTFETAEGDLQETLSGLAESHGNHVVLVDSLTMWMTDRLLSSAGNREIRSEIVSLIDVLTAHRSPLICVSDDVSGGIVPADPLSRRFRDIHGELNQVIAANSDLVVHVTAGIPLALKGELMDFGERK